MDVTIFYAPVFLLLSLCELVFWVTKCQQCDNGVVVINASVSERGQEQQNLLSLLNVLLKIALSLQL